jgi:hypothetical protein
MNTTKKEIAEALKTEPKFVEVIAFFQNLTGPSAVNPLPKRVEYIAVEAVGGAGMASRYYFIVRKNFDPIEATVLPSGFQAAFKVLAAIEDCYI